MGRLEMAAAEANLGSVVLFRWYGLCNAQRLVPSLSLPSLCYRSM